MSCFALDPATNDLFLDDSRNFSRTSTKAETLAQRISTRLSTFLGEWYLDRSLGVPYFEEVLVKNPNIDQIRSLLITIIADTEEVKQVTSMEVEFNARLRTFTANFVVMSTFGETVEGGI